MNYLYNKTLVKNHFFNTDVIDKNNKQKTIYQLISENENLITFTEKNDNNNNNNNTESVSISFFGRAYNSTGRLFCPNVDYLRKDIHEFIGNVLSKRQYLNGSMVIRRNILKIQHVILDFDLKKTPILKPRNKINIQEFRTYNEKRNTSFEQKFIYFNDNNQIKKLNINFIIYEILILLRNLGIEDDIYIMGKRGGCFEKGFHIEVPSFLMNYHDLVIFYEIIHSFIKNDDFFDATLNYSAFGSTKLDGDSVYLPYCCFNRDNDLVYEKIMFENLKSAFDFFNIFKPLAKEENNVHYFDVIFKKVLTSSSKEKENVITMMEENETRLKRKIQNLDNTIPEEYYRRDDNNDKSNLEKIRDIIKNDKENIKAADAMDAERELLLQYSFCERHEKKTTAQILRIGDLSISGRVFQIYKVFSRELMKRVKKCDDVSIMYRYRYSKRSTCYRCQPPNEKFSFLDHQSYIVNIINKLTKYPNTLNKSFIFGEIKNGTVIIIGENEKEKDEANEKKGNDGNNNNNNFIFDPRDIIFSDRHIFDLYDFKDLEFTIHFLISGYFSCLDTTLSTTRRLMVDWLWLLGDATERDIILNFLQIYNHVRRNSRMVNFSIDWIRLSLKHLIVNKNVIRFEDAVSIIRKIKKRYFLEDKQVLGQFAKKKIFNVRDATHHFAVPNVITAAILMCSNEAIIYELLAIYRPIVLIGNGTDNDNDNNNKTQKSSNNKNDGGGATKKKKSSSSSPFSTDDNNKIITWDGSKWKRCQYTANSVCFQSKEIYYIANIYSQITAFRREMKKENMGNGGYVDDINFFIKNVIIKRWNNDNQNNNNKEGDDYLPDPLHCINVNNIILNQILHKIAAYWAKTEIFTIPSLFITILLPDKYILAGLSLENNELITIKPIPMYFFKESIANESDYNCYDGNDSNNIDELLAHIKRCSFLNGQFFPLVRKILNKNKNIRLKKGGNVNKRDDVYQNLLLRKLNEKKKLNNDNRDDVLFDDVSYSSSGTGGNISCFPGIDDVDPQRGGGGEDEKKRKIETKRDLHLYLTEEQCKREETIDLIKLTKYFTLKQIANSYGDMIDVYDLLPPEKKKSRKKLLKLIKQYVKGTETEKMENLNERVTTLANCYEVIAKYDVRSAGFPRDIPTEEMTVVECDCALTRVCISLLQTFSYDIPLFLYFLRLILRATCSDNNDFINKLIHIFLGETNSGKTTVLHLTLSAVGHLAGILSPHTTNHSSTIDRYHDLSKSYSFAKFWYMDEIANKPFNRQLINQITGNSRVFIRANYESGNNVKLASTILIFGNNKPTFTEQCSALINRLRYISFRSKFDSKSPINFKLCNFPKLKIYDDANYQSLLRLGMKALFLHATCSSHSSSPFYLYDTLFLGEMETTQNMIVSNKLYSPINEIIEKIFLICNLIEDSEYVLTQKRMTFLLNGFDIMNKLDIPSISDAITFISKKYPLSIIEDKSLLERCQVEFRDVSVFYGIREINVLDNDDRISYARKRKMDDHSFTKRQKKY